MGQVRLWILVSLAFFSLAEGLDLEVMSAPNLLRAGNTENIFLEIQDCTSDTDVNVEITLWSYPTKTKHLASTSVVLMKANGFQSFGRITIPLTEFRRDPNIKQYVYLQAHFPTRLLERVVLVSFHAGYIFIQTDRTLYSPKSTVIYRLFGVRTGMELVGKDDVTQSDDFVKVQIEFQTPDDIILPIDVKYLSSGLYSGSYKLDGAANFGKWKIMAKFHSNPQHRFAAEFEVGDFVPPSFEVTLTPVSSFFHVNSRYLTVNIRAKYLSENDVDGMAYACFGITHDGQRRSLSNSHQRVSIRRGQGSVTLQRRHITEGYGTVDILVGSSIFVEVTVMTGGGGELAKKELRDIKIVTSPYTINFKKTPKYYRLGTTFNVAVEVLNPDGTPARRVPVVLNPGEVFGQTSDDGVAKVSINPSGIAYTRTITATTRDPAISQEAQASATMEAGPYTTNSDNYIQLEVQSDVVRVGDFLRVSCTFRGHGNADNDVTYLISSRGQLVNHGKFRPGQRSVFSFTILVTKLMLPSFRIVAYYHTSDNDVVSDSVWADVKDACVGSLRLEPGRPTLDYNPRRLFVLKVTGDPGANVALFAVNKSLKKSRLTHKKMWDSIQEFDTGCTPGGGRDGMSVFYDAGLLFQSASSGTPTRQELKCPSLSRRKRATDDSSDDDTSYVRQDDIIISSFFPESWIWTAVYLPSCPGANPNCDTTSTLKTFILPDTTTSWQISAISLSKTQGLCVADPLEIIARKLFLVDLRMPHSAVLGEQLEVKAILHNTAPDQVVVRVDLLEAVDVCSAAYNVGKYRQIVQVEPFATRSVSFILLPMKVGYHDIYVVAAVRESSIHDAVRKSLLVVPNAVLVKSVQIINLDPANKGVDGQQDEMINGGISRRDITPNTPARTLIYVTGGGRIPTQVEDVLPGNSTAFLIYRPTGSGEWNMMHMANIVIATIYLDKTNQWETVGLEKRYKALQYIRNGYSNELASRKSDGSFSLITGQRSSTWLTAQVVKVFTIANSVVGLQVSVICDAVRFLIVNAQMRDGSFREVGERSQTQMMDDRDGTMTAFCLIAVQESRPLCISQVSGLTESVNRAVAYLERRLSGLGGAYAVAMTSYALANENKLNRKILFSFASQDVTHWPVPKGIFHTVEATAYALLALVRAKALKEARPVVRWLNQQGSSPGGFGSSRVTLLVYQASAEYWVSAKEQEKEPDLNVNVLVEGRLRPIKFHFDQDIQYSSRLFKFNDINKDVNITARGTGEAVVKMVSEYYAPPKVKASECERFILSVKLLPERLDEDEKIYTLTIEILSKDNGRNSTMSILEIGLLAGFTFDINDLFLVSKPPHRIIEHFEMGKIYSERSSIVIYMDKVSHAEPEEVVFRIRQKQELPLQPAAVSVYELNEPERKCVKFYHPERPNGELLRLCKNNECKCAEAMCPRLRSDTNSKNDRLAKIDETTPTRRIDFVYKVRVKDLVEDLSSDTYTVEVERVIQEGSSVENLLGKNLTFLSHTHCRESLHLRKDKTYLVMGSSRNLQRDEQDQTFFYILNQNTWIEYWPADAECQAVETRSTCLELTEMENNAGNLDAVVIKAH